MPKFISRYSNYVIVMKPPRQITDENGNVAVVPGKYIQFADGVYQTRSSEEVKFLRSHKDFGLLIFEDKSEAERAFSGEASAE